ncbi:MAG: hypothetical protein VXY77_00695 [Pseudomonadota bacterium]|nr:hypothetical protein [Pseudomonadota bacterium]
MKIQSSVLLIVLMSLGPYAKLQAVATKSDLTTSSARPSFNVSILKYTGEEIRNSGTKSLAEFLQLYSPRGGWFFVPSSGHGTFGAQTASVNLGNTGALNVSVDGIQLSTSPLMGGVSSSVSLQAVPLHAIDYIELVPTSDRLDGFSELRIVTTKDTSLNIGTTQGRRHIPNTKSFLHKDPFSGSMYGGLNTDNQSLYFWSEYSYRPEIYSGERDVTGSKASDINGDGLISAGRETQGLSYFSRNIQGKVAYPNIVSGIFGQDILDWTYSISVCPGSLANPVNGFVGNNFIANFPPALVGAPRGVCLYDYTENMVEHSMLESYSGGLNHLYRISPTMNLENQLLIFDRRAWGRLAPPAASWKLPADHPENIADVPVTGYWRWDEIGNRANLFTSFDFYAKSILTKKFYEALSLQAQVKKSQENGAQTGRFYLSYTGLADAIANNQGNLTDPLSILKMRATTTENVLKDQFQYMVQGFGTFELNTVLRSTHHWSLKLRSDRSYMGVTYDSQSEAQKIGGSGGNSFRGGMETNDGVFNLNTVIHVDRIPHLGIDLQLANNKVSYGETALPDSSFDPSSLAFLRQFKTTLSAKSKKLYRVSGTVSPYHGVKLEASTQNTVQYPDGADLFGLSFSFYPYVRDTLTCASVDSCPETQIAAQYTKSISGKVTTGDGKLHILGLGYYGDFRSVKNIVASATYENLTDNLIMSQNIQELIYAEVGGDTSKLQGSYTYIDTTGRSNPSTATALGSGSLEQCSSDFAVMYGAESKDTFIIRRCSDKVIDLVGISGLTTEPLKQTAFSLRLGGSVDSSFGELTTNYHGYFINRWDIIKTGLDSSGALVSYAQNHIKTSGMPGYQGLYSFDWSKWGIGAHYSIRHIGETYAIGEASKEDPMFFHNISASYLRTFPTMSLKTTMGVRNATNTHSSTLYMEPPVGLVGRVYYVTLNMKLR